VSDDILGYGPIDRLLKDDDITEVMVNGPDLVFIERSGKVEKTGASFVDETHLRRIIDKIVGQVGRRIDEAQPLCDARLPDGSRVNAVIHPLAIGGPFLTIRKFSKDPYQIDDLIRFGTMNAAPLPAGHGGRSAEHHRVGRYRHRQDHHLERAVVVHPGR
jgi:pilus assembly protein CpaF